MNNALIGHSGFVGTTLLKQRRFDALFRSTNMDDIGGRAFDLVICAAAPAQKWRANQRPEDDLKNIRALMSHIESIQCRIFILISTVDVFSHPAGVNETSPVEMDNLQPYGHHRHLLEMFVKSHFPSHLIIRLPGLVGAGLRKNVVFDLLNDNNLSAIDSRSVFQFYPMLNLWHDIKIAMASGLDLIHLTAEPVSVADIAIDGFGINFENILPATPPHYDFQTIHAEIFNAQGPYQYARHQTMQAICDYARTESKTLK